MRWSTFLAHYRKWHAKTQSMPSLSRLFPGFLAFSLFGRRVWHAPQKTVPGESANTKVQAALLQNPLARSNYSPLQVKSGRWSGEWADSKSQKLCACARAVLLQELTFYNNLSWKKSHRRQCVQVGRIGPHYTAKCELRSPQMWHATHSDNVLPIFCFPP